MFHYHHGVPLVAQFLERMDQLPVVALMKSDARFIQDVQYIDQLGADLCRESDALALTA